MRDRFLPAVGICVGFGILIFGSALGLFVLNGD